MHHLPLKPLSLNAMYRGRRFTTPELKRYKEDICLLSPRLNVPSGKLQITYLFGVSSKAIDADNLSKGITDGLSAKYGFNDRMVYKFILEKVDVPKGSEFIKFNIEPYGI